MRRYCCVDIWTRPAAEQLVLHPCCMNLPSTGPGSGTFCPTRRACMYSQQTHVHHEGCCMTCLWLFRNYASWVCMHVMEMQAVVDAVHAGIAHCCCYVRFWRSKQLRQWAALVPCSNCHLCSTQQFKRSFHASGPGLAVSLPATPAGLFECSSSAGLVVLTRH